MKDNFSSQSDKYAQFRPSYPNTLFKYLKSIIPVKHTAWDCGTGNGQIAIEIAKFFNHVFATDISESQIKNAKLKNNIFYSIQSAEHTNFSENQFDLIIVAQAIHWFNFDEFYNEVFRTSKKDGTICIVGYGLVKISKEIDEIIDNFYFKIIGEYWDKERKYIDQNYKSIPFPFNEIEVPVFKNEHQWTLNHFIGYLNTWSAVKHFIKQNDYNPTNDLKIKLNQFWNNNEKKEVTFPILLRIGKIKDSSNQ